jgi:hypothetical protein
MQKDSEKGPDIGMLGKTAHDILRLLMHEQVPRKVVEIFSHNSSRAMVGYDSLCGPFV